MNRVGVFTSVLETNPTSYNAGELSLVTSKGDVVKLGSTGPFPTGTTIDLAVGLADGTYKRVITITPKCFDYSAVAYKAAVGKTVRVGYTGSTGKLIVVDPTLPANINKYGTLSVYNTDVDSAVRPSVEIHEDVQISTGETTATLYAKLQAAGTKIAARLNAKYGAGTVTFNSGSPVLNAASSYLEFVFAKTKVFTVTLDGIFDTTPVTTTAGADGPVVSGLTGAEVQMVEKEAAVLDGYNPTQSDKRQMFNVSNYVSASLASNYDALQITTTSNKEYESPGSPKGWDVTAKLYSANSIAGTIGANIAAVAAILAEVKTNNGVGLTKAQADILYAAHA